jgi:hypothetical protein
MGEETGRSVGARMQKFSLTVPFSRELRKVQHWKGVSKTGFKTMRLHLYCIYHTTDVSSRLGKPQEYSVPAGDPKASAVRSEALLADLGTEGCLRNVLKEDEFLNKYVDELWKELGHAPASKLSPARTLKLAEDLRRAFTNPPRTSTKASSESVT